MSDKCTLPLKSTICLDSIVLLFAVAPPSLSLRASLGVLARFACADKFQKALQAMQFYFIRSDMSD